MKPWFETVVVTKGPELAPGADQRSLDSILGLVRVAQDPKRDRHATITDSTSKGIEGLSITTLRTFDERLVHPTLPLLAIGPLWTRSPY